ncbi:MAG: response regulator [Bacteroidales bacterium]|nr:response regulator [Bacteroidales bacterium]
MNTTNQTPENIRANLSVEEDLSGRTFLVVDDIKVNYLLIKAMLMKARAETLWAESGFQAIEMINSGKHFDAILMDYNMPGMDGFETTIQLKRLKPELPVISQSTYTDSKDFDRAVAPFDEYISKPIVYKELIVKLKQVLKT